MENDSICQNLFIHGFRDNFNLDCDIWIYQYVKTYFARVFLCFNFLTSVQSTD